MHKTTCNPDVVNTTDHGRNELRSEPIPRHVLNLGPVLVLYNTKIVVMNTIPHVVELEA